MLSDNTIILNIPFFKEIFEPMLLLLISTANFTF